MDNSDVIIIGTGAGGGTLAAAPRPLGEAHPPARARRLASARAAELVGPGRVRGQPLCLARHLVRREGQAVPAGDPLLRRRIDEALRRRALPAAEEDFGELRAPRRTVTGLADASRRGWTPCCTLAGSSLRQISRRTGARTRAEPPGAGRTPARRRSPRPAYRAALRRSRGSGAHHVPRRQYHARPVGASGVRHVPPTVPTCDGFPCLRPCGVRRPRRPRRAALRASRCHAVDRPPGPPSSRRATEARPRPALVVDRDGTEGGPAACVVVVTYGTASTGQLLPRVGDTIAPRRPREAARSRSGRHFMFQRARPPSSRSSREENHPRYQEPSGSTTSTSGATTSTPAGERPDGRQVDGGEYPRRDVRRDTKLAPSRHWSGGAMPSTSALERHLPRL